MRNNILFLLLMLPFFGQAQQTIASTPIEWKSAAIELHTIGNGKSACTIVMRPDSIRAFQTDASGALRYLFNMPRKQNEKFLGGFFKGTQVLLFLDNGDARGIHSFQFNLQTKELVEHSIPFEIKQEYILQRLSTDNYFVYLTLDKKTPEFVLYQFADGKEPIMHRFAASESVRDDLAKEQKGTFSRTKMEVEKITMAGECNLLVAKCRQKLYVQGDSIFLIINKVNGRSQVYTFDLQNYNMQQRLIAHQPGGNDLPTGSSNSFLLRNKLYYAAANKDSLHLQVCDFYTGKIIRQFTAFKEGDIEFLNNAATGNGGTIEQGTRKVNRAAPFLNHPNRKRVVIAALVDDATNEVQLSFGTVELIQTYTPMAPSFGGPLTGSYAGVGGASLNRFDSEWELTNVFKSRLDAMTAAHRSGQMPYSINEKIADYTEKIKIPRQGENLELIDGKYYYIFYDKRERTVSAVVFD